MTGVELNVNPLTAAIVYYSAFSNLLVLKMALTCQNR